MRRIVGNWKANGSTVQAQALCAALPAPPAGVDVTVCPPLCLLWAARGSLPPGIRLGAQDVSRVDGGAFTGEVTAPMLLDAGCVLALVGHSERRQQGAEDDALIGLKLRACWRHGLLPVLCVGETAAQRRDGSTDAVLAAQVGRVLAGAPPAPLWMAYEPVWAIGTGQAATPEDCARGIAVIRAAVAEAWPAAPPVPCLYGGSVHPANCAAFWREGGADGALVGGASLDAAAFVAICRLAGDA